MNRSETVATGCTMLRMIHMIIMERCIERATVAGDDLCCQLECGQAARFCRGCGGLRRGDRGVAGARGDSSAHGGWCDLRGECATEGGSLQSRSAGTAGAGG